MFQSTFIEVASGTSLICLLRECLWRKHVPWDQLPLSAFFYLFFLLFCFVLDDYCIECWHQILWALFSYSFLFCIWNIFVPHLPTYSYIVLKCGEQWQLYSWTPSMQECINNHLTFKYLDNYSASQRHRCHQL